MTEVNMTFCGKVSEYVIFEGVEGNFKSHLIMIII